MALFSLRQNYETILMFDTDRRVRLQDASSGSDLRTQGKQDRINLVSRGNEEKAKSNGNKQSPCSDFSRAVVFALGM